jgi:hypothetical protein
VKPSDGLWKRNCLLWVIGWLTGGIAIDSHTAVINFPTFSSTKAKIQSFQPIICNSLHRGQEILAVEEMPLPRLLGSVKISSWRTNYSRSRQFELFPLKINLNRGAGSDILAGDRRYSIHAIRSTHVGYSRAVSGRCIVHGQEQPRAATTNKTSNRRESTQSITQFGAMLRPWSPHQWC